MIELTRLNDIKVYVNADLIEFIESSPDTIITLTTGKKIIVTEKAEDVVQKVIDFKGKIYSHSNIFKN